MIYINRLAISKIGWSFNFQRRFEKGLKELNIEYKMFPEKEWYFDSFSRDLLYTIYQSDFDSLKEVLKIFTDNDKLLFLEPFQFPIEKMIALNTNIPFSTFIHIGKDYFPYYSNSYMYQYYEVLPKILCSTKAQADTYINKNKFVVGMFLNSYKNDTYKDLKIMWAGYRVGDEAKGWSNFLNIVRYNKDLQFIAFVKNKYDTGLFNLELYDVVDSNEYINECRKHKFILSTANVESFGLSVFDAVSVGCIPILPGLKVYLENFPKSYFYDGKEIKSVINNSDRILSLEKIVNKYNYLNVTKNIINSL